MIIGIYTNLHKDIDAKAALQLIDILKKKDVDYRVCDNAQDCIKDSKLVPFDRFAIESDIIVAFGGDGTMLKVFNLLKDNKKPILGVNLGKIGFLSEISVADLEVAVNNLINNQYEIEERQLLKVNTQNNSYVALNEAVLQSSTGEHISVVEINIDSSYTSTVRSDGVMVSTPTGSTAYSLACNGPILSPNVKAFLINSICPHSLKFVPMVVSDESEVVLKSLSKNMRLVIDGKTKESFYEDNAIITIKKCENTALFVRFGKENFYQKLLQKLSNWGE